MTVREYRFDDPGAPQLTGQAGSLAAVLKACLVSGYGSGGDTKPGAGWSNPFSGTNIEVLRNDGAGGSGAYFQIDDSASGAGGAKEALVHIYSAMTDATTGSNKVPASDTGAIIALRKSVSADAVARNWWVIASEKTCYLMIGSMDVDIYWNVHAFGDYGAFSAGYGSPAFVAGRPINSAGAITAGTTTNMIGTWSTSVGAGSIDHGQLLNNGLAYGSALQLSAGKAVGIASNNQVYSVAGVGTLGGATNAAGTYQVGTLGVMRGNTAVLLPVLVHNYAGSAANQACLGKMPGLFDPLTFLGADGTEYAFSGEYAGRTFKGVRLQGGWNNPTVLIETTAGAW